MTQSDLNPRQRGLVCDDCGAGPLRKPAIDLGLLVFCVRCAPRHGLFPGEHGEARSYDEWKRLASERQDQPKPQWPCPECGCESQRDPNDGYCRVCTNCGVRAAFERFTITQEVRDAV